MNFYRASVVGREKLHYIPLPEKINVDNIKEILSYQKVNINEVEPSKILVLRNII